MMKGKRCILFPLAILFIVVVLAGCAGPVKRMEVVTPDRIPSRPESGKSMVVFMRPSGFGFGIQSSVFEVRDNQPLLAGIVAAKKKVAYQLDPGEHLFMVVGESADFMSADLEVGKTYHALVTPRMGVWKARFSLRPVHADTLTTDQFVEWEQECEWVVKILEADQWARENMPSILAKQKKYYKAWMSKDASERPRLLREDGR
jgi:hypothetical protein